MKLVKIILATFASPSGMPTCGETGHLNLQGYGILRVAHVGIDAQRASHPRIRAVVLMDSSKREFILQAFGAGARGIFSRHESVESLCKCVRSVHEGQNLGQQLAEDERELRVPVVVLRSFFIRSPHYLNGLS